MSERTDGFRRILKFSKKYLRLFILDMFFCVINLSCRLLMPFLIYEFINKIMDTGGLVIKEKIFFYFSILIILICIICICTYITCYYGHLFGLNVEKDIKKELFKHIQTLPIDFFDNNNTAIITPVITHDLFQVAEMMHHIPEEFLSGIIRVLLSIVILFSINKTLAGILTIIVIPCYYITIKINKPLSKLFLKEEEKNSIINKGISESLNNVRAVKMFSNEKLEIKKFNIFSNEHFESKKNIYKSIAVLEVFIDLSIMITLPVICCFGAILIYKNKLTIQGLMAFLLYRDLLTGGLIAMLSKFELIWQSLTGVEKFFEILKIETEKYENKIGLKPSFAGDIVFKDVCFAYDNVKENVLENINFTIKSGEHVAIIGASGEGKSTICALLCRFYNLKSGNIFINNTNISDIDLKHHRKNVGYVGQDSYLFSDTIFENIRYGRPESSNEEVFDAAIKTGCSEFIEKLPLKYYTNVGQNGAKLSSGQKQRIALARIFLKNPEILIFDESTNALDDKSEEYIKKSIKKLSIGKTVIIITHKSKTLLKVSRTFNIKNKTVTEI